MWFTTLLSLIPGLFSSIDNITNAIANEKIAALNATTQQAQIEAQEKVNTLQAQRDVLIADASHSSVDLWIRAGFCLGPLFILNKIYIYDKIWDGTTILSPELWNVIMAEIGFYFLYSGAVTVSKILKA